MPRPKEFDGLRNISLSLESDMIDLAKYYNLNISKICRAAIRKALEQDDMKKFKKTNKFSALPRETVEFWREKVLNDKTPVRQRTQMCAKMFYKLTGRKYTVAEVLKFYQNDKEKERSG